MCWPQTVWCRGQQVAGTKKYEEEMETVWKYKMISKVSWKDSEGSGNSVRSQLEDRDVKWQNFDVVVSPEN